MFFGTNFGSFVAAGTLGVGVLLLEVHPAAKTIATSSSPTTITVEVYFLIIIAFYSLNILQETILARQTLLQNRAEDYLLNQGFIRVQADSIPPETVPSRLASISRTNLLSLA